jgi:hypothetical protein
MILPKDDNNIGVMRRIGRLDAVFSGSHPLGLCVIVIGRFSVP